MTGCLDTKPNPSSMSSLLMTMDGSVNGRIPDILGDGDEEASR